MNEHRPGATPPFTGRPRRPPFTIRQFFSGIPCNMPDEHTLALRQIDGARGDLYAIADELEVVKMQLAQLAQKLPSRAYLCRSLLMATASIWALVGAVALLVVR